MPTKPAKSIKPKDGAYIICTIKELRVGDIYRKGGRTYQVIRTNLMDVVELGENDEELCTIKGIQQ